MEDKETIEIQKEDLNDNSEQAKRFLQFVNDNYNNLKKKWAKYLIDKQIDFDEDVYSDTILKVFDYINTNGIKDDSDSGFANYFFRAFNINVKREKQYSRNVNRDKNIDATEELSKEMNGEDELKLKIRRHVYEDWSIVYILRLVEDNFDSISFHCFRLYYILDKMTYSKLREITKVPDSKKRVVTIKNWLKDNLTKQKMEKEFSKYYDTSD